MNAHCSQLDAEALAPERTPQECGEVDHTSNFLYQAATVLGILLFLISF